MAHIFLMPFRASSPDQRKIDQSCDIIESLLNSVRLCSVGCSKSYTGKSAYRILSLRRVYDRVLYFYDGYNRETFIDIDAWTW